MQHESVCVCVRERERERERVLISALPHRRELTVINLSASFVTVTLEPIVHSILVPSPSQMNLSVQPSTLTMVLPLLPTSKVSVIAMVYDCSSIECVCCLLYTSDAADE